MNQIDPTLREELVFFPFGENTLAGVLTIPSNPIGRTAIVAWGAGVFPSSARNQFRTRLAREIAQLGYHSFRFDYPGVGEADGHYRTPVLEQPFSKEIVAVYEWLSSQGLVRPVIIANCFGAWSTLHALNQLPDLAGLVAYNCPIRRDHKEIRAEEAGWRWWTDRLRHLTWRRLMNRNRRQRYAKLAKARASAITGVGGTNANFFARKVESLVKAGVPMLFCYGDDGFRGDYEEALDKGLRAILESAGPGTGSLLLPKRIEGFPTISVQNELTEGTVAWLRNSITDQVLGAAGQS